MEVEVLPDVELSVEGVRLGHRADDLLGQGGVGHDVDVGDRAVPELGITLVVSIPAVVVLPAPLGPRSPKISPRATVRLSSSTALKSAPA